MSTRKDAKRPNPVGHAPVRQSAAKGHARPTHPWSKEDVKELRALAKQNTPTGVLSLKLQRPETAIRNKAFREGISLKPTNRSPYTRRKKR
jgi:hypothetical protein